MKPRPHRVSLWIALGAVIAGAPGIAPVGAQTSQPASREGRSVLEDPQRLAIVRGEHPRLDGIWPQYLGLGTSLRANVILSDVLRPDAAWENYRGAPAARHDVSGATAGTYDDTHNHYQNLLCEVWNFAPGANAVAIWGDSAAIAPKSKAWGAFFSARSYGAELMDRPEYRRYVPQGVSLERDPEFDAQLIGIEIDVLNHGKPGVWPNMSKTGVQIVGFDQPCSMAIEVRCEDTDKDTPQRRGQFECGMYLKNSLAEYGRVIVADFERAKLGLDFRRAEFSEGAVSFRSSGVGTGLVCNLGNSGEVYGGRRWPGFADEREWLSLRAGAGGVRLVNRDNTREIIAADNDGGIYLTGDIFVNGARVDFGSARAVLIPPGARDAVLGVLGLAVVVLGVMVVRMQRALGDARVGLSAAALLVAHYEKKYPDDRPGVGGS